MYIARVLKGTVKGRRYYTHRLIGSERIDGKMRRRTILELGAHYPIPKEQWPLLCRILDEMQSRPTQQLLLEVDPPKLVIEATYLLRRIRAKEREPRTVEDADLSDATA